LTIAWFVFVLLNFTQSNVFLFLFVLFAAVERFWETFLASKQNILDKKSEFDWLFKLISYYYVLVMFGTVMEYLFIKKRLYPGLTVAGIIAFFLALALRLGSIRALGGSWNTCVLGKLKRKLRPRRLIRKGPYKFLRHPIYLGAIVEALSIPAIFNSYCTLGFVILLYVPLLILRAYLEEQELIRIFGKGYVRYQNKTVGF